MVLCPANGGVTPMFLWIKSERHSDFVGHLPAWTPAGRQRERLDVRATGQSVAGLLTEGSKTLLDRVWLSTHAIGVMALPGVTWRVEGVQVCPGMPAATCICLIGHPSGD